MIHWFPRLGTTICCAALLTLNAHAAEPAPGLAATFPQIRRQLADADFSTRLAGQKELDKIPPTQVEALRALAAAETDPEVKARLDTRVDAMEQYNLIHPAPLTVNLQNATLATAVAEMNKQLGGATLNSLVGGGAGGNTYTLKADNRPFWDIISELHRQNPISITSTATSIGGSISYSLRLTPGGNVREYKIVETFAFMPPMFSGQPGAGSWSLRLTGYSDPRVRIMQYSPLRIEKITDQDGRSLLPLVLTSATGMSSMARPMMAWTSAATFDVAPGVTRIKEMRASIALSILEKEQTLTIDLTKETGPIDTARGQINIIKNAAGDMTLRLSPAANAANPPVEAASIVRTKPINIRVLDQDGKVVTSGSYYGTVTMTLRTPNGAPSKVELSWPDKTREIVLPVEYTDLEVPAGAGGGRLGGVGGVELIK